MTKKKKKIQTAPQHSFGTMCVLGDKYCRVKYHRPPLVPWHQNINNNDSFWCCFSGHFCLLCLVGKKNFTKKKEPLSLLFFTKNFSISPRKPWYKVSLGFQIQCGTLTIFLENCNTIAFKVVGSLVRGRGLLRYLGAICRPKI